jgi:hypothetical protein
VNPCTHGFNTYQFGTVGGRAWMTNSHCTDAMFQTNGTRVQQPVAGGLIGYEFYDPPLFWGSIYFPASNESYYCGSGCRFSDAALVIYWLFRV